MSCREKGLLHRIAGQALNHGSSATHCAGVKPGTFLSFGLVSFRCLRFIDSDLEALVSIDLAFQAQLSPTPDAV